MATLLHSDSRHLYSWWWDSHISPKNSKWLQENLADIDAKVKAMIKIINEDADSFARRAEMYYKKRPELMKLVEEFYRAYRALAERYDHATGELRLAHRTMIEAFPNQASFMLSDDTPSGSEPPSPLTPQLDAMFDPDDLSKDSDVGLSKKGLKHLNEMFQTGEAILKELKAAEGRLRGNLQGEEDEDSGSKHGSSLPLEKNHNVDLRTMILNESERAAKVEAEMRRLKQALAKMEAERDAILVQYRQSLEKLSNLEKELNSAQIDAKELDKHASEAQSEVKALKGSLEKLEAERHSSLCQLKEASKRLASLEAMAAVTQGDITWWRDQAVKAGTESQNLKQELSRSEADKQKALAHYQQSLEKISALEDQLQLAEANAKSLCEQNEQAESEIKALKEELSRLNKEKEDVYLRYQHCLDVISKLQNELMEAKEEVRRLNGEILLESEKLKGAEDQCALLEKVNQALKLEANDLVQEIAAKDQMLSEKHTELEKLMNRLKDEQSRFMQVEATLHTLQNMHFQSQEEQRALAVELRNGLQMLKDVELCKRDLELEIQCLREENRGLNDLKLASSIAEKDMHNEILSLKEIKEKLEAEVRRQAEQNEVLQQQFCRLKGEIEDLYKKYQDLLQQVESAGVDPKCLKSSIKDLQDENSRLKRLSNEGKIEKEALLRRLEDMEGLLQKSAMLESSLSDVKVELESSKEKMKALQTSCDTLGGEKSNLMAEKSALLSQLQIITESMQKLLENNVTLENSLQSANIELEGLRVKSKSLEEFCQFLKDEKSNLVTERSSLVYRLECVEKKLEKLETRFTKLEDKYAGLEKERDSTRNQVEELRISLGAEKQERQCFVLTSEARLSGLEDRINHLQEENKCRKKDFEEQLEKAVNAQVEIFILQKFMKDMEERNYTLLDECQKHAEAAKYSEKIISELESENMMQHLETEYLLDRVDKFRRGICQVLKTLEIDHVSETDPEIFVPRVRGNIKDIRRNLSESKDENQQLLIQNNVLSAVVLQLSTEGLELTARKKATDHEFFLLNQQHVMLKDEKDVLLERTRQLDIVVAEKERGQETLKVQMEVLSSKQVVLEKEYVALQKEHSDVLKANWFLQDKLSDLKEENHMLEEENSAAIAEALCFSTQSVVFKSSWIQKAFEFERVAQDMCCLQEAYSDLENEIKALGERLAMEETENIQLRELIQQLEEKNHQLNVCNDQLNQQCFIEREQINQKEAELLEAEQRIKTAQDLNTELSTTVEGLQVRCEALDVSRGDLEHQVFELSECREHQEREIVLLREANGSLETEVGVLNEEIEACKIREVILSTELHERSSEFELWEAEATSFYFDLQISSVREALLENKVHELSGLCQDLEDGSTRRSIEIDRMKNKINFLETESEELKSKLAAYVPAIAFLKDNIASLEQIPVVQTKLLCPGTPGQQVAEFIVQDISESNSANAKKQSFLVLDGLSELQNLQSRVKAIESVLVVENNSVQDWMNADIKLEAGKKEIEKLKSRIKSQPNIMVHDVERKTCNRHGKSWESGPGTSESRNGTHMKDIPLDHVSNASSSSNRRRGSGRLSDQLLELWETSEQESAHNLDLSKPQARNSPRRKYSMHRQLEIGEHMDSTSGEIEKELGVDKLELSKNVTELKQGANRKIILERLASDAQKLASLQISVEELRRKMETNKKSKATKDAEHKRLKGQLQDIENSIVQLVEMNTTLTKTIKESPSTSDSADSRERVEVEQALRRKMLEQARRDSESIGSLQLEMQKIQYILLKLEDEKSNTNKGGKSRFSRSRTGIILREFVYGRGRRSRKQKKPRFCGCFRPSHKEV